MVLIGDGNVTPEKSSPVVNTGEPDHSSIKGPSRWSKDYLYQSHHWSKNRF